jgi:hypothetical protein
MTYIDIATSSIASSSPLYSLLFGINFGLLVIVVLLFIFVITYIFNHFSKKKSWLTY